MMPQWDPQSGIRERLALLAALASAATPRTGQHRQSFIAERAVGFTYDPSADRWEWSGERMFFGPVRVQVSAEASVQLARLHKLGIGYHEAMRLIGYAQESEQP